VAVWAIFKRWLSWSGFFRQVVEGALVGGAAGGISGAELSGINYTVHHFPALK
jgi:hypothetical protein